MIVLPNECGDEFKECTRIEDALDDTVQEHYRANFWNSSFDLKLCSTKFLCVLEGEQALLNTNEGEIYIGSVEATTCLIVIVICRKTDKAWVCHFNQGVCGDESFLAHFDSFMEPELFIVGSYSEPSGVSLEVLHSVWNTFAEAASRFVLRLSCVLAHNVLDNGYPRCRQMVMHLPSGVCSPSCFENYGPEVSRRLTYSLTFASCSPKLVYDPAKNVIVLEPFLAKLSESQIRSYSRLLSLEDKSFLEEYSTSPDHESDRFVPDMKKKLTWVLERQNSPEINRALFRWTASQWTLLNE